MESDCLSFFIDESKSNILKMMEESNISLRQENGEAKDKIGSCVIIIESEINKFKVNLKAKTTNTTPNFVREKSHKAVKFLTTELENFKNSFMKHKQFSLPNDLTDEDNTTDNHFSNVQDVDFMVHQDAMKCAIKANDSYSLLVENFHNKIIKHHVLPGLGSNVLIRNLKNCTVELKGVASTIRIETCQNVNINLGIIQRSVMVDNIINSQLNVACQQARVHNSIDSIVRLHVTGSCILLNSRNMIIGNYSFNYPDIEKDFEMANLGKINKWRNVSDFDWPRTDVPSPHFKLEKKINGENVINNY